MATRAVIDVGTNSVKLLVAEVAGQSVDPLFEGSEQTRLGAGFYETHRLSADAIQRTAEAVKAFAESARRFSPVSIHVIATSAARDAVNQQDLLNAIYHVANINLAIITGDQEAEWAFGGVATDPRFRADGLLVMDIGGGSTEFVVGRDGHRESGKSFQIGSVRLLEKFRPSDPPTAAQRIDCLQWLRDFFTREVKPFLAQSPTSRLVSTGGTSTILARMKWKLSNYDREKIESQPLTAPELAAQTQRLWSLPLAARKELPGLPSSRADVILTGAAILEAAVETLGFSEACVSTRGLRFGALVDIEAQRFN